MLKQYNYTIQNENMWKYTNMNPTAPNLHPTIKLHKPNIPIRPVINCKNAPAYGLAKQLTKMLHNHVYLPYTHNVRNSIHIMTDLQPIELNRDMRICSFDIKNMYINIPKRNAINIINNILESHSEIHMNIRKEIMHIMQMVMEQNYFQFDKQYKNKPMGYRWVPNVSMLAET
jgi:hypothetical protein